MLTARQQQTYQFIKEYIHQHQYAPTEAEIAEGIGIRSRGVVHRYLTALANEGLIELIPNQRRNIRLLEEEDQWQLPLLGKIAAGQPLEVMEDEQHLDVAKILLGPSRFVLEVKGDSMIGDNICDGDYIICETTNALRKNTIAVVLVDNQETTLKRIYPNGDGSVTLIPSNPTLSPMVYDRERIQVQGIYIGLLRLTYFR